MGNVIKKKKPLLSKIIAKIKGGSLPDEYSSFNSDVSLGDVRISGEDMTAIDLRRNDLKAMKHSNADSVVSLDDNG